MRQPWKTKSSVVAYVSPEMSIPNCQNFATCYMELCRQKKLRPLPVICVTLPHSLDFTTDRVKMDDWGPILNSLSLDRSLRSVSVRSRYQCRKPLEEVNSADKARAIGKAPVVLTRYLLERLSHSVAQCIRNSSALTCLELEGVPLPDDCLAALCVGLAATETLQHLSFQRCYIGDNSCALVCRTIADVQSIRSLNLSQCDLSNNCGPALAAALSRQKLLLYHDTWKDSLRYREPNLDTMPGLRRLTLNGNPHLGNSAVAEIIDAIQDSLWLKALDLQNCGLTGAIGNDILQLLDHNTTLEVIDLRCNINLSDEIVDEVFKKLEVNNIGSKLEYRLLKPLQKDSRIFSVDIKREEKSDETVPCINHPRSQTIRNSERSRQPNLFRKTPPLISANKITKINQRLPHFPIRNREIHLSTPDVKVVKPLLHLDLQTQLKSTLDDIEIHNIDDEEEDEDEDEDEDDDEDEDFDDDDNDYEKSEKINDEKIIEFEKVLKHLSGIKEKEKLINQMRQMEVELKEERTQREVAEMKLRMMRRDLEDLENTLKAKEIETRGYLLISQKSLDEISKSFEELLNMLDDIGTHSDTRWRNTSEREARETIKRKVTLLLRKTKSEKIGKSIFELESLMKFAKSTGDVRTSLPPILSQLEKKVGDTADVISPSLNNSCRKYDRILENSFSSCERARALFAQIVNGDLIVNLRNHIS